ncbi:MAG TPA: serine--tRNA ligase [Acidobacteriota bacterium]|nr:serine--tRNA ligase [Acidobacteriota bacterium]
MLDIRFIRDNVALVKENILRKGKSNVSDVDELLALDNEFKVLSSQGQALRASRNTLSEQINKAKKEGKDASDLLKQVKELPQKIKLFDEELAKITAKIDELQRKIPNIIHPSVPNGASSAENVERIRYGNPTKFDFTPKSHQEIAAGLGMADFEAAAQTSGNGFYYLQGDLALLNQALLRFAIETLVNHGFLYVETPYFLRKDVIRNVVDLADMENQIYKLEGEDLYMIGTSEHSLIGRYINATLDEKRLPIKQTSYSMCFRREKGAHGLDERGLFRTHQFNKIEMVVICDPADSMKFYKVLQDITIEIFTKLGIPIRVLDLCTGDLNDLKHIACDIEAWSPRRNTYIEVGSCSNLTAAQAQMLNIRAAKPSGDKFYPHTLNNTAIATSRALVAILENNQTKEGTVVIPKVLAPFMFGKTHLTPIK